MPALAEVECWIVGTSLFFSIDHLIFRLKVDEYRNLEVDEFGNLKVNEFRNFDVD